MRVLSPREEAAEALVSAKRPPRDAYSDPPICCHPSVKRMARRHLAIYDTVSGASHTTTPDSPARSPHARNVLIVHCQGVHRARQISRRSERRPCRVGERVDGDDG